MPKAVSKAQAKFFGAIAGGQLVKPGLSKSEAKKHLEGVKYKDLPKKKKPKKK